MIKLNNKKITYVALADSNNSVKGVKEIWYADSSNSVKLVYRRKDALIEGEDYEKYHWLCGRNGAYINTLHKLIPCEDVFECHFKWDGEVTNPNGKTQCVFGCYFYQGANCWIRAAIAYDLFYVNYFKLVNWNTIPINGVNDVEIKSLMSSSDSGNYSFTLNGETHEYSNNGLTNAETNADVLLFENIANNGSYFQGDIAYFRITDPTFTTDKLHLIPCKLLKPVPKWLDTNGIRRQVGECGMIDLVSGKFYGNVNSVGTFTVENYYERKEWLQGRNGAYINTMHPLTTYDDAFYVKAHFDGTIKNPNNKEQNIFGYTHLNNDTITDICRLYINSSGRISCNYYIPDGNWSPLPDSLGLTDIEVYSYAVGNNHYVNLNDTLHTLSTNGMQQQTFGSFIALFSNNGDDDNGERLSSRYFHGDIASFRISDPTFTTDKMSLIPCILTMDLPASMDANNIARTKGTSGMWDLVSDRFYGNVADSGTFKAVNLAEGVDYEVHDWLVGDGSAVINTNIEDITNLTELYCYFYSDNPSNNERIFGREGNSRIVLRYRSVNYLEFFTSPSNNPGYIILRFDTEGYFYADFVANKASTSLSSPTNFTGNSDKIGNLGTIYLFGDKVASGPTSIVSAKIKSFRAAPFMDLVPCKLLRSIPSKYDANGIARQAGECGMYDTVNDVFYGNVASSGSFTVEDDN